MKGNYDISWFPFIFGMEIVIRTNRLTKYLC